MAPRLINLRQQDWIRMREHILSCLPEEACGLLGGIGEQVHLVVPITNRDRRPSRYRMDPQEQVRAMLRMEDLGFQILGIYHSHPLGPSHPSGADTKEVTYPEAAYLIWSPQEEGWRCRAFDLSFEPVREIPISILSD
jgi:proteasome lid subunit RPN8/RPN11